jgi:hypothetical protein
MPLVPQGVSKALRRRAGRGVFRDLGRQGLLPLGGVAVTGPGQLPVRWILHAVALHATSTRVCPRRRARHLRGSLGPSPDATFVAWRVRRCAGPPWWSG